MKEVSYIMLCYYCPLFFGSLEISLSCHPEGLDTFICAELKDKVESSAQVSGKYGNCTALQRQVKQLENVLWGLT